MRVVLLSWLLMIAGMAYPQSGIRTHTDLKDFIPKGYDSLEIVRGDLNKDKIEDVVLILKSTEEDKEDKKDSVAPRLLIILFRSGSSYKLIERSANAVLCHDCGGVFGDPFAGAEIKNGVFEIQFYGGSSWRWSKTFKFRWQQGTMKLIGATRSSYWSVEHCDELGDFAGTEYFDINYLTGSFEEKKISNECKLGLNRKGKKKILPLTPLSSFSVEDSF